MFAFVHFSCFVHFPYFLLFLTRNNKWRKITLWPGSDFPAAVPICPPSGYTCTDSCNSTIRFLTTSHLRASLLQILRYLLKSIISTKQKRQQPIRWKLSWKTTIMCARGRTGFHWAVCNGKDSWLLSTWDVFHKGSRCLEIRKSQHLVRFLALAEMISIFHLHCGHPKLLS